MKPPVKSAIGGTASSAPSASGAPGERGEAGDRSVAGGPVAESVGEFGEAWRVLAALGDDAYGVADPDHRVRGTAVQARQQPGPPLGEHIAPGPLLDRPQEVRDPVGAPARVAQRLAPVGVGDGGDGGGEVVEPDLVRVQPPVHGPRPAVGGERLGHHGGVVGETPIVDLGPGGVQPLQGLFENAAAVRVVRAVRVLRHANDAMPVPYARVSAARTTPCGPLPRARALGPGPRCLRRVSRRSARPGRAAGPGPRPPRA